MTNFYTKLAKYYDQIYGQIDYENNSKKLHEFIQQYKKSEGISLLDVACGTGTHIMHLMDKYEAMGFDLSDEMLKVARKKCPSIDFVQGDMVNLNLGRKFDVITCLFGSIGHLTTEEELAGAIKASQDYSSGLMVSVYPFGSGTFILNTLLIRNNLGTHPAAERLLRNLLRYAARDQKKSIEKLPADFDTKLKAIGYK